MNPYGETAPLVDLEDFQDWILEEDDNLLIINKPGWFVCHPSKNGPQSSLVGLVGLHTGAEKLHLIARLDRETSGLVVFAKRPSVARKFQMAIQSRIVDKAYLAIVEGTVAEPIHVDEPVARRRGGPVFVKSEVSYDRSSQSAVTDFYPLISQNGYTLCRVEPETGRKHQIRIHAEWLQHRIVGDKIYGPDETLYIDFIEQGWTDRLEAALPMQRQALHCWQYTFRFPEGAKTFRAPLQADMIEFCNRHMGLDSAKLDAVLAASLVG